MMSTTSMALHYTKMTTINPQLEVAMGQLSMLRPILTVQKSPTDLTSME